jgi:hypothetical protein
MQADLRVPTQLLSAPSRMCPPTRGDSIESRRKEENMASRILVVYASKHGTTREVAESIAETLRQPVSMWT